MLRTAVAMVAAHLAFRAWATYSSWYTFDDFTFMSKLANSGTSVEVALEPYAGHVMPAGMYLSWLANEVAPFDFRATASMLLLMQLLADVGMIVMLVRLFGARPGILPPLALYQFCVISFPVAIWWAAGVNQLPLQVVLFWSVASHVQYLRTRRTRHLVATVGWLVLGLLFYEKTILVLGAIGIISLAYFTSGDVRTRLRQVWERYRAGTVVYVVVGAGYLAWYVVHALNFSPKQTGDDTFGQVLTNMLVQAYAPALLGGPLTWTAFDQFSLPAPGNLAQLGSVIVLGLVVREIHRTRARSLRAWFLPGFFLACDIALVVAGRASFVGALISLDFRYQGELAAVTALALACATMPIRGAVEPVVPRGTSPLVSYPARVAGVTAVVAVLGTVSSVQYAVHWSSTMPGKPYFTNLIDDLHEAEEPVPLVDEPVPGFIMWPLGYPTNLLSHLLTPYADETEFVDVATDHLSIVDESGSLAPAVVTTVRYGQPGSRPGCGYQLTREELSIPLDGPVAFGGWWVRIGYLSSGSSPVVVSAGDSSFSTVVEPGVHALYFRGGDEFESVRISGLARGVSVCTDDVVVGRARPATEIEEASP